MKRRRCRWCGLPADYRHELGCFHWFQPLAYALGWSAPALYACVMWCEDEHEVRV